MDKLQCVSDNPGYHCPALLTTFGVRMTKAKISNSAAFGLLLAGCLFLGGCASMVSSMTGEMATDLEASILNSRDVETVREGIPAYLLLIDSFLRRSPKDEDLLLAASNLHGSFSVFIEDKARSKLLTDKSLEYALKATCVRRSSLCDLRNMDFETFKETVDRLGPDDVPTLYQTGVAWAGWIEAHSGDWNAVAELGRVKYLMAKIIELDETWEAGGPHLYMGALKTIMPAAMGGKPEEGRRHFEKAMEISNGRYLMTKVVYAEQYARLTFNRSLHDRLLNEVIEADPIQEGMTLVNKVAQQQARELLAGSDDYF